MTTKDEFVSAQDGLIQQITALKKQSVLALGIAVVFILTTVYLIVSLNSKKKEVENLNQSLTVSEGKLKENVAALEALNDSIKDLNKQLDNWRLSLIQEKPVQQTGQSEAPQVIRRYNYIVRPIERTLVRNIPSFFGFIIYIQDRKNSMVSDSLRSVLRANGAIVPAIQHMAATVRFANAVKYFHPEDKATAERIQKQLADILLQKQIDIGPGLRVSYLANNKVPKGQFEVWIDK